MLDAHALLQEVGQQGADEGLVVRVVVHAAAIRALRRAAPVYLLLLHRAQPAPGLARAADVDREGGRERCVTGEVQT